MFPGSPFISSLSHLPDHFLLDSVDSLRTMKDTPPSVP